MPLILQSFPTATLEIAGEPLLDQDDVFERDLRSRIAAMRLEASVRLLGFRRDIPGLIARATLVIHPSTCEESFGLVPLEAMAAGRAVVASRVGGIPEVVRDGECGLLVPPGEHEPLASAIISLLADPTRRAAFGASGRRAATETFSIDRMIARLNEVFARAIGDAPFREPASPAG
jgi:glycosyltransferase involved in cell wall biosynthesis